MTIYQMATEQAELIAQLPEEFREPLLIFINHTATSLRQGVDNTEMFISLFKPVIESYSKKVRACRTNHELIN